MPDAWETVNGCDPATPDQNTLHASGYTMLEMYLDYAMTHRTPMDDGYHEQQAVPTTNDQRGPDWTNKILRDGQLLIQRGDRLFTVQGQEVR